MRQLVLLRHAKAAANSDTGEDFDRPLAARGREDAPVVGKALAAAGADPQLVLVSSAKRTRETWALVAPSFPAAKVEFRDELYLGEAELLFKAAEEAGVERVMVIAHNPGLHELASRMAPRMNALESTLRAKYPTAAGAIFERKDDQSSLRLKDYITPKNATD
jgi:phosphohistidine phosphatase